ncbi:hypothetical protein Pint_29359 [Pistacia integerrima]|uniref:Uncharacterized protein n=1 Tax=Pistacia integerrima TaxID=434235 RepID=A0ACC0X247_9ROSI|nr:hypothetical protein Pint_29359 [Pistacia integerrima]
MATTSNLLFLIVLHATALSLIGCYAANQLSSKKLLFVFGDSLFDPGNNQYLNNSMPSASTSWPYGMNMNNKSTGRLSDGLLVPDFVALFANLPLDPPCMQPRADLTNGANFASAGAGVLGESNGVMNLNAQLTNFKKVVSRKGKLHVATVYNGKNCGVGSYKLCKNPSEYVFFDGGHTTQKTNRQLAELLWSGVPNVTGPYNVKQLFEFP